MNPRRVRVPNRKAVATREKFRGVAAIRSWRLEDRDASLILGAPLAPSAWFDQRAAKQQAQEEDRRVRLERLRSENVEEVGKVRTDAAESLSKAEQAWETERGEMERELTEKVGLAVKLIKDVSRLQLGMHNA